MSLIEVLSPVRSADQTSSTLLAPRVELPADAHLILIANGKPKAIEILELLAEELRAWLSIGEVELHSKSSAGRPLEAHVASDLASRADLAIAALGDCGACSACSLHDAVQMERLGVPATLIITDVFQRSTAAHARTLGLASYHTVVLPHPVSTRSDERLRQLVHDAAPAARDQLIAPARELALTV
jgi:hypothetical protein